MPFRFDTEFPRTDPECTPRFSRNFEHIDWIDGESIVQAESTMIDEGFNSRFRKIITDLDALCNDARQALACAAGMRQSLHDLLGELEAELQRLDRPPENWVRLTLQNGWRDTSSRPHGGGCAVFKDRGMIHLRGRISPPEAWRQDSGAITVCTLPSPYRPDIDYHLPVLGERPTGEIGLFGLFINVTGQCILSGAGIPTFTAIRLDGVTVGAQNR
jgi:hypothetical protein